MTAVTKEELTEKVKTFYEQLIYFVDVHYAFLDIEGAFDYQNNAKSFFGVAACACIDSYMMTAARLFDTHKHAATIKDLISECRQNISFFADQNAVVSAMDEFENKLQDTTFNNLISVIKHRRNKYIAHNDPKYFLHKKSTDPALQDDKQFSLCELWFLIKDTRDLLDLLWLNLSDDDIGVKCQYKRDLMQLLPENLFPLLTPLNNK